MRCGAGTYQPPIAFSGSGNVYRGNRVGQVPHTYVHHYFNAATPSNVASNQPNEDNQMMPLFVTQLHHGSWDKR